MNVLDLPRGFAKHKNTMSAAPKNDPNNEIFVRREDFDRYFSKPIPKATFFRWVNEGKVKKARDLDGWYKLNATLMHQGLPEVDLKAYRASKKKQTREYRKKQLLFQVFKEVDPALEFTFDDIEEPETLEPKEVEFVFKASEALKRHFSKSEIRDVYQRSLICKDLLDEHIDLEDIASG